MANEIQKITVGFVVQTFDKHGRFQDQTFIAGDQVDYVDADTGEEIAAQDLPYVPFDMAQDFQTD